MPKGRALELSFHLQHSKSTAQAGGGDAAAAACKGAAKQLHAAQRRQLPGLATPPCTRTDPLYQRGGTVAAYWNAVRLGAHLVSAERGLHRRGHLRNVAPRLLQLPPALLRRPGQAHAKPHQPAADACIHRRRQAQQGDGRSREGAKVGVPPRRNAGVMDAWEKQGRQTACAQHPSRCAWCSHLQPPARCR